MSDITWLKIKHDLHYLVKDQTLLACVERSNMANMTFSKIKVLGLKLKKFYIACDFVQILT